VIGDGRIDIAAGEPQFLDHLLPVWQQLPKRHRGCVLYTKPALEGYTKRMAGHSSPLRPASNRATLVASISDLNVLRRAQRRLVAYMEHGVGQSYHGDKRTDRHPSYAGGPGREHCGLIMAPNELAAAQWRKTYPNVPVHVIGATRALAAPAHPDTPCLAISFHWNGGMPEMQNAFTHYHRCLQQLGEQLPVIGHGHPRMLGALKVRYRRAGIEWVPNLAVVARRATVYAVDNSSTLYELGRTRPVIALNQPHYRKEVEHGLRFWSHIPGPQVEDCETLLATARRLLYEGETPAELARRQQVMAEVFPRLDGAAEASRLLVSWLTTGSA